MFYVYVIENRQAKRYAGSTSDLSERIKMHNNDSLETRRFHYSTYRKGPWHIIFSQSFDQRREALDIERFLKTGAGREWLERARLGG